MLDSNDINSIRGIQLLVDEVRDSARPLVFWIGAGASAWCGYPLWPELAQIFHSDFIKHVPAYEAQLGLTLLGQGQFSDLFQLCRDSDKHRFYRLLADIFRVHGPTPVYRRFVGAIGGIKPVRILTTNVDELLEKSFHRASQISGNDLERVTDLLDSGDSFICKLHGAISDIRTCIFTSQDYKRLVDDPRYQSFLQRVLSRVSIVFIGYGLQDDHVLKMLRTNQDLANLFGDGPHFTILPNILNNLPSNVHIIRYIPQPHKDHRSSIAVIEEIRFAHIQRQGTPVPVEAKEEQATKLKSAHMLSSFFPPGTWETSTTALAKRADGYQIEFVCGTGFSNKELPIAPSTAMHDLIVALICFDQVIAPIEVFSRIGTMLGHARFWPLVRNSVLSFVHWSNTEAIVFPGRGSISMGELTSLVPAHDALDRAIRSQLNPMPGKEREAEDFFLDLRSRTIAITAAQDGQVLQLTRSLLLRPSIRKSLGVSLGTPLNSLARWHVFPILRLASVVKIGVACKIAAACSTKLDFGTALLAGPAFALTAGKEWTDEAASYVVCGRFGADLGKIAAEDSEVLDAVLSFRDTQTGESFRREILDYLSLSEGAEVNVAVNGALKSALPYQSLQKFRDEFVGLWVPRLPGEGPPPALWNDRRTADDAVLHWRHASKKILDDICSKYHIKPSSPCPCGSGEKLKFCCQEALLR